ncbi:MAG: hypothetical protein JWN56_1896 [Sphingobacteriales bacterium]|nr:hypothetical protein [Sphingobacteriales bacterium]
MRIIKTSSTALLALLFAFSVTAQVQNSVHITKRMEIGGTGGWDYIHVSSVNKEIYVSHGTKVNIVNQLTGDSVGVIPNTNGVHGITIVNSLNKGYTSNGRSNTSTVFNSKTHQVLAEIATGKNPDAIFYEEYSKKIFICNGASNDATIIDPLTDHVIATIPLGGKPETAVSDGKGSIYVNIEDTSEIVAIDAKTFKVKKRWKLKGGEEPSGLDIDKKTNRLFAGCGNKLMVVLDAKTGKTLAQIPIGDGCDGIAFDEEKKLIFSSNGEGTLTVIKEVNANKFTIIKTIKTERGARTIALDPKKHEIYLSTASLKPATNPDSRPQPVPGTFHLLVVSE